MVKADRETIARFCKTQETCMAVSYTHLDVYKRQRSTR